jgi:hypothetical protein
MGPEAYADAQREIFQPLYLQCEVRVEGGRSLGGFTTHLGDPVAFMELFSERWARAAVTYGHSTHQIPIYPPT